jgi:hypothetical protein
VPRPRLLAAALALCLIPGPLLAKGLNPEDAAAKRAEIDNSRPSSPRAAMEHFTRAGEELGDPELFLRAGQLALGEAERSRDPELAREAAARALIARDIALYLADDDNYAATDWRPVTPGRAAELAELARELAREAEQLEQTIFEERAAAEAKAREPAVTEDDTAKQRRSRGERRPGTGLIIGGSVALTLGVGGLGMVGAGVAMGQARQRDADELAPGDFDRLSELDRQGAQANTIAYAGIGLAAVGIAVGAALIVVGVKQRKAAGGTNESALRVGGWIDRETGGVVVGGRF